MPASDDPPDLASHDLKAACDVLNDGGVVAFPTETSYGLAVNPRDSEALERLYALKERPREKPVLTLVADLSQLEQLALEVPEVYRPLINKFWPGPLTLIFPANPRLPSLLSGDTGTVGVRISSHPVARQLVAAVGGPVTATSANFSGKVPCTTPEEVRTVFGNQIDFVVDGGRTAGGLPSTVLTCFGDVVWLVRDGAISYEEVQGILALAADGE